MARHVVLLRGINLVRTNRIAMAELREALAEAGYRDAVTYLQSGNAIVSSARRPERIASDVNRLIMDRFGFDIAVIVRSGDELDGVIRRNPLRDVATNPRRHLVTFLGGELPARVAAELRSIATEERFAVVGRQIYSWHPDGVGRTPLWERLAARSLGISATSRNWTTVMALAAMANNPTGR